MTENVRIVQLFLQKLSANPTERFTDIVIRHYQIAAQSNQCSTCLRNLRIAIKRLKRDTTKLNSIQNNTISKYIACECNRATLQKMQSIINSTIQIIDFDMGI